MTKDRFTLTLVAALAMAVGALGAVATRTESASAQVPGERVWRQCFMADFDGHADGSNRDDMQAARGAIYLPPGWTPVGGAATPNNKFVVLCR